MRVDPELTYQDYKDGVIGCFNLLGRKGCETAEKITNWMADEDDDLLIKDSTSLAIWIITIGEYEIRHYGVDVGRPGLVSCSGNTYNDNRIPIGVFS